MLEIDLAGVYLPAPLVWAAGAFVTASLVELGLARIGFYRLVWHRGLFDLALLLILCGALGCCALQHAFAGSGG